MKIIQKICNRETISYLIFGVLTTLVDLIIFWICNRAGIYVAVSNIIANIGAVIFAFFVNKIFVFLSTSWNPIVVAKEIFLFFSGRLITILLQTLLLILLVDILGFDAFICKVITTVLVVVSNYFISKKAVFKVTDN